MAKNPKPKQTEQDFSRSNSTYLNVAYRTLKDPTLRAKYLVRLPFFPVSSLDDRRVLYIRVSRSSSPH